MTTFDCYQAVHHDSDFLTQPDSSKDDFFQPDDFLACNSLSPPNFAVNAGLGMGDSLSDELGSFDFDFDFDGDATTTSGSLSVDSSAYHGNKYPGATPPPPSSSTIVDNIQTTSLQSTALRPSKALPTRQDFESSISAVDLLSIEGKRKQAEYNNQPVVAPAPTLRRKNRFAASIDTLRNKLQGVHNSSSKPNMEQMYYTKEQIQSYPDWAHRFGQISLQQSMPNPQLSPQISASIESKPMNTTCGRTMGHKKSASEHLMPKSRFPAQGIGTQAQQQPILDRVPEYSPQTMAPPEFRDVFQMPSPEEHTINHARLRQTASWSQPVNGLQQEDFAISPQELQSTWIDPIQHNADSYFANGATSLPTPEYPSAEFALAYTQWAQMQGDNNPNFALGPASEPLSPHSMPFQPTENFQGHKHSISSMSGRARTPQLPMNNISTPPISPTHSNHRHSQSLQQSYQQNQASQNTDGQFNVSQPLQEVQGNQSSGTTNRSANRRSMQSKPTALRLPKSVGNLRAASKASSNTIARDLRSPKSATTLKHAKSSGNLRTSPTKGSGGGGDFGFVNFTPMDSGRILTGVAPSGSSKTKARREMEAADRKRRLSLAAERVIREAGGDVEELRKEGLL